MMSRMRRTPRAPAPRQNPMIPPLQIQATMHLDQQPDKHRYKQRASQHMRADDIKAEICEEDKRDAFDDGEVIRDLRVHFGVFVVGRVDAAEEGEGVEGDVDGEEERVVDYQGGS